MSTSKMFLSEICVILEKPLGDVIEKEVNFARVI